MTLERNSMTLIVIFFSLLFVSFGLIGYGITDVENWITPVASLVGGMVLFFEVGFKIFASLHKIKSLTAMQYVSLIFGVLSILNGILTLPTIGIDIEILRTISSTVLIVVGVLILAEWFTQRS